MGIDVKNNLPTARNLRIWVSAISSGICAAGGILALLTLRAVLHFTPEQSIPLIGVILCFVICLGTFSVFKTSSWMRGMDLFLNKIHKGDEPSQAEIHQAFADVMDYPRKLWLYNQACFVVGGITI